MNDRVITIPLERYNQLLRAEQDANHLKKLLADKYESYGSFDRFTMELLYTMYCEKKEDKE